MKTSHQNGPEDSGADAIGHLKLSFVIGSCEVVVPPRTKHPENKEDMIAPLLFASLSAVFQSWDGTFKTLKTLCLQYFNEKHLF